jgi:flagellar assembly factor FliW
MKVATRDFGTIQIDDDSVYSFPQGVYGFEASDAFAVFMHEEEGISFTYLQAVHAVDPCFLVFSPWDMFPSYEPLLLKEDLAFLGVQSEKDLIFLTIATVPLEVRNLSINIKSPVALNPLRMIGMQAILQNEDYPVKYKPFLAAEAADPDPAAPIAAPAESADARGVREEG